MSTSMRICFVLTWAVCLGAGEARSQVKLSQSLADDWTHVWAAPHYTDDVATAESVFGKVDQLNYVWWLLFRSPQIGVSPGLWGARCRIKKTNSASNTVPLELKKSISGESVTLAAAGQAVDAWTWTPDLRFEVSAGFGFQAAEFQLLNIDSTYKTDYWFDQFELFQVSSSFGSSCGALSAGVGGWPSVGSSTFALQAAGAPLLSIAFCVLGASSTSWGGVPLPLDLALFGAPGCDLLVSPGLIVPVPTAADGTALMPLPLPADPSLTGLEFHTQWLALDPVTAVLTSSDGVTVWIQP